MSPSRSPKTQNKLGGLSTYTWNENNISTIANDKLNSTTTKTAE